MVLLLEVKTTFPSLESFWPCLSKIPAESLPHRSAGNYQSRQASFSNTYFSSRKQSLTWTSPTNEISQWTKHIHLLLWLTLHLYVIVWNSWRCGSETMTPQDAYVKQWAHAVQPSFALQDQKLPEEMQRGWVGDAAHPIIGTVHATSTSEKPFYPLAGFRTSYR